MNARSLPELVQELPPDAQEVVRDLVEFLLSRPAAEDSPPAPRTLRQDWAGALLAYRREYTSLDLQHRAAAWRVSP
jgi:hypothetical protein